MEDGSARAFVADDEEAAGFADSATASAPSPSSWLERRRRIQADALALFAAKPPKSVTIRELTRACQVSSNTIYGWFGDIRALYREAVEGELRVLARSIRSVSFDSASPRETIAAFAEWSVELFESGRHRDLLYIVVRDRAQHDWLSASYREWVLEPLEAQLRKLIRAAGARMDMALELEAGEARAFVDRLFADFSMPQLLPRERKLSKRDAQALLDRTAAKAVAAIREAEPVAASLAALLGSESRRGQAAAG